MKRASRAEDRLLKQVTRINGEARRVCGPRAKMMRETVGASRSGRGCIVGLYAKLERQTGSRPVIVIHLRFARRNTLKAKTRQVEIGKLMRSLPRL